MQNKQDKKKKTKIKLNDLQPKKDAKGGMVANNASTSSRSVQRSQHNHQANIHI